MTFRNTDDIPGGDGYVDITEAIERATEEMSDGEMIFGDQFSLLEAMSAIEIMAPQMDSGMAPTLAPDSASVEFDPFARLLPEEVLWILDRSFACEMGWYTGRALAQTVYTLLYMHELPTIEHKWFSTHPIGPPDLARPDELVSLVLRSGVIGLVKSCHQVHKELLQRNLYDTEDYNADKFELSLLESIPVANVIMDLMQAGRWLEKQTDLPWRDELLQRINLRKNLLRIHSYTPHTILPQYQSFLSTSLTLLSQIASSPFPPTPPPTSPARAAFDPTIIRRLVSHIPIRIISLYSQEETFGILRKMLEDLEVVAALEGCESLICWKETLTSLARDTSHHQRIAYVRSVPITTFSSAPGIVLGSRNRKWLLERIFLEMADIPPSTFQEPDLYDLMTQYEGRAGDMLISYFVTLCHNRPRQRRIFSNILPAWRILAEETEALAGKLERLLHNSPFAKTCRPSTRRLPLIILHIRSTIISEVVFSGFELDLYDREEWPFIYWYASRVCVDQGHILRGLEELVKEGGAEEDSSALEYIAWQLDWNLGLQNLCFATFSMLLCRGASIRHLTPTRQRLNIERRFKWAFQDDEDPARPDVGEYERICVKLSEKRILDNGIDETHLVNQARVSFLRICGRRPTANRSDLFEARQKQYLTGLIRTCSTHLALLKGADGAVEPIDDIALAGRESQSRHPWFPDFP